MRMRHIVIFGLPHSTVFSTISHRRHEFRKIENNTEHKMHALILSTTLLVKINILRRIELDMIINVCWSLCCKVRFILVRV